MSEVDRKVGYRLVSGTAKLDRDVKAGDKCEFSIDVSVPEGMTLVAVTRIMPMTINLTPYVWEVQAGKIYVACRANGAVSSGLPLHATALCLRSSMRV